MPGGIFFENVVSGGNWNHCLKKAGSQPQPADDSWYEMLKKLSLFSPLKGKFREPRYSYKIDF